MTRTPVFRSLDAAREYWRGRAIDAEQQNAELLAALIRTERKLSAYVGVCTGDKELLLTVLPMAREAIAKAGK